MILAPLLGLKLVISAAGAFPYAQEVEAAVKDVRDIWLVPRELVLAVIRQESNFNPGARSKAGAIGLMQVMPFNARKVGLSSERGLWVPAKNILAGTRLLAVLLRYYDGDLISTLAAYNARPRKLLAPLPRNGETPDYVTKVLAYYRGYGGGAMPAKLTPADTALRSDGADHVGGAGDGPLTARDDAGD